MNNCWQGIALNGLNIFFWLFEEAVWGRTASTPHWGVNQALFFIALSYPLLVTANQLTAKKDNTLYLSRQQLINQVIMVCHISLTQ